MDGPADVGSEGLAGYDIRYSTSPISEANFQAATQIVNEPAPAAAGTLQTLQVTGPALDMKCSLASDTQYYFAIKSFDRSEPANLSALTTLAVRTAAAATVHNVSSIPQFNQAMSVANPGDEIQIAYGVYQVRRSEDAKHWFTRSGTAANPIRIIGMPGPSGEKPVFDATGGQRRPRHLLHLADGYASDTCSTT